MSTVNEIMKGLGKFFIILAFICLSVISIISLRDIAYRISGVMLTLNNALTLLAIIVYVIALVAMVAFLMVKQKQPEPQQNNDMMNYISDIYVNVNKNTEALEAIIAFLQQEPQQEDAETK